MRLVQCPKCLAEFDLDENITDKTCARHVMVKCPACNLVFVCETRDPTLPYGKKLQMMTMWPHRYKKPNG